MANLKKRLGLLSASFIGISSIVGSGWLFSAYRTANIAGPAAILAWVIAGVVILMLALCFSEIAALYPRRGLSAVIATLSHNKYFGFPFAIANWLGIVAVMALEADATVEYLINIFPHLKPYLFINDELTLMGNSFSICLILLFALLNYWGVNVLTKANNVLAILKIAIPLITGIVVMGTVFKPHNFILVDNSFVPYGWKSIFTAIITTGIIISFNGFQSIVSFANEVKRPHRTIPLSLTISITFCLGLYLLLQVAYIGAMPDDYLANGWSSIVFNAPMVQLCSAIGLGFLSTIIYAGAFFAPSGTALTFMGASSRMFTAMAKMEQMPKYFTVVDKESGMPRRSLYINTIMTIIFLLVFKSWDNLAIILSLFHVISYLPVPLGILVFRQTLSTSPKYRFKLRGGHVISLTLFVIFNCLIVYSRADVMFELFLIFLIFQAIFICVSSKSVKDFIFGVRKSFFIFMYLGLLSFLTYLSPNNYDLLTGLNLVVVVLIFSVSSFYYLVWLGRNDASLIDSVFLDSFVDGH